MRDRFGDLQRAVPGLEAKSEIHPADDDLFEEHPVSYSAVFDEAEGIRNTVTEIVAEITRTRQLHNTMLSAAQPDQADKEELERITATIKKKSKNVQAKLGSMANSLEEQTKRNTADYRIQKAQHTSLTRYFVDTISEYHNVQNMYRERCKDRIQRQLEITGNEHSSDEVEDMLESGNPAIFTQGILVDTAKAKMALSEIQERHTAILKLESSIIELHTMFQDMAILVQQQGEMIDRIEYNVSNTEAYTREAVEKLKEARQLQKKSQCCCCLKCCSCTIL